ncbi:MAG: YidC/Oxa1 family membrane protein insertase [Eubacteriales bacterium]|mgnify:FL=1|jgi:YidC/Oxa1 family membrane protein insertase|nr:YidC/Oxa1 family membrane protein insertase [Eubacteriales bacterium]NLF47493.1 membrane protein insertase YidC [Clostridiales bacterium]
MNTIIGALAQPVGWLLSSIYDLIGNYGITLIVFTLIVKVCLYPLYSKQIKSTARMAQVQPKMKALQQKYANDKQTLNMKLSEMYKEEKFNPAAGCLPMLIQMPIIFGIFALLRNPLAYLQSDEMLFAVHESFLWMVDLSQPDKWILPILAGIATFISFRMTSQQQSAAQPGGMGSMMKMMQYFFPVMIVLMGRSFPAGLTIYWFVGQFIQIFFNLHLNKVRKKIKEGGK